jgi:hypothetical protein
LIGHLSVLCLIDKYFQSFFLALREVLMKKFKFYFIFINLFLNNINLNINPLMELFYNLFSTFNKFARVEPFILLNNSPFLLATYLSPLKK